MGLFDDMETQKETKNTDEFGFDLDNTEMQNDGFVKEYKNQEKKLNRIDDTPGELQYTKLFFDHTGSNILTKNDTMFFNKKVGENHVAIELCSLIYPSKHFTDNEDNRSIEVVVKSDEYITRIVDLKTLRNDFWSIVDNLGCILYTNNSKEREIIKVHFMNLISYLIKTQPKSVKVQAMGWQEDGSLVVGLRRFDKNGERTVQVDVKSKKLFKQFTPVGDIEKFKKAYDGFFSFEKLKYHHCYLLIGLGSPLLNILKLNGSVCSLRTHGSGTFKTVTQKMMTGFYMNDRSAHINDFTHTFVFDTLKKYQNFPVIIEEISEKIEKEPEVFEKLVYDVSAGKSKGRADNGGDSKDTFTYNTNLMTSNNPSGYSALDKTNIAKLLRYLEIDLEVLESPQDNYYDDIIPEVIPYFNLLEGNCGFGSEILKEIVKNKDEVKEMLDKKYMEVSKKLTGNARYIYSMVTVGLVMADILKDMGFNIDIKRVEKCFDNILNNVQAKVGEVTIKSDNIIDLIFSSLKVQQIVKTVNNKLVNDENAQNHIMPDAWCLDGKELRIPVDIFENKLFNGSQKGMIKMLAGDGLNLFKKQNIVVRKEQLTMFKVKNRYYIIEIPMEKREGFHIVKQSKEEENETQQEINKAFG